MERALEFALNMEEESVELYTSAQDKALNPSSKILLKELVREEENHKKKILEAMKDPAKVGEIGPSERRIEDLKIVEYLEDVSLSPDADYQRILIYASKREKAAHDLYIELASKFQGKKIGEMFSKLAREELKHKYKIEQEYDDVILKWM